MITIIKRFIVYLNPRDPNGKIGKKFPLKIQGLLMMILFLLTLPFVLCQCENIELSPVSDNPIFEDPLADNEYSTAMQERLQNALSGNKIPFRVYSRATSIDLFTIGSSYQVIIETPPTADDDRHLVSALPGGLNPFVLGGANDNLAFRQVEVNDLNVIYITFVGYVDYQNTTINIKEVNSDGSTNPAINLDSLGVLRNIYYDTRAYINDYADPPFFAPYEMEFDDEIGYSTLVLIDENNAFGLQEDRCYQIEILSENAVDLFGNHLDQDNDGITGETEDNVVLRFSTRNSGTLADGPIYWEGDILDTYQYNAYTPSAMDTSGQYETIDGNEFANVFPGTGIRAMHITETLESDFSGLTAPYPGVTADFDMASLNQAVQVVNMLNGESEYLSAVSNGLPLEFNLNLDPWTPYQLIIDQSSVSADFTDAGITHNFRLSTYDTENLVPDAPNYGSRYITYSFTTYSGNIADSMMVQTWYMNDYSTRYSYPDITIVFTNDVKASTVTNSNITLMGGNEMISTAYTEVLKGYTVEVLDATSIRVKAIEETRDGNGLANSWVLYLSGILDSLGRRLIIDTPINSGML